MKLLVLSCSLSDASRSRVLAEHFAREAEQAGVEVETVDLREIPLPFCDGGAAYGAEGVAALSAKIAEANGVVLAVPVYNYDVGGAARNLIAMTGKAWEGKVVGFLGAAGGDRSYMALMSLANSLMLDFRCVIVPRFVYASAGAFDGDLLRSDRPELDPRQGVEARIAGLAEDVKRFSAALGT